MFRRRRNLVRVIENTGERPLTIWLEPWCHEAILPSGSKATLRLRGNPKHTEVFEIKDDWLTIWCNEPDYSLDIDGKTVLSY